MGGIVMSIFVNTDGVVCTCVDRYSNSGKISPMVTKRGLTHRQVMQDVRSFLRDGRIEVLGRVK